MSFDESEEKDGRCFGKRAAGEKSVYRPRLQRRIWEDLGSILDDIAASEELCQQSSVTSFSTPLEHVTEGGNNEPQTKKLRQESHGSLLADTIKETWFSTGFMVDLDGEETNEFSTILRRHSEG
jgi:hypothetical protein